MPMEPPLAWITGMKTLATPIRSDTEIHGGGNGWQSGHTEFTHLASFFLGWHVERLTIINSHRR